MDSAARGEQAQGGGRRGDTRQRIQQIALELFAEQGYERTSLREIAERLGVTKAALYYHFKSKEDIVGSFTGDYLSQLDELVGWAKEQPRTADTAEEILDRYIGIVMDSREVFRFLERNQAMVRGSDSGGSDSGGSDSPGSDSGADKHHRLEQFRPRMNALVETIIGPDAPARSRVRATAAFFAVSVSCMFFMPDASAGGEDCLAAFEPVADLEELRKIVIELAGDIVRGVPG
ncbi:MAG: TetR/AcrR family transcriptional regulator [Streptosporangiales bacterium]|nr:TetR/AcrR family transcriptional regulator [Streptosporangiales bacterium]